MNHLIQSTKRSNATVSVTGGGGINGEAALVLGHNCLRLSLRLAPVLIQGDRNSQWRDACSITAQPLMFGSRADIDPVFDQESLGTITTWKGLPKRYGYIDHTDGTGLTADVTTNGQADSFVFSGGNGKYTSEPLITISEPDQDDAETAVVIYKKNDAVLNGEVKFTIKKLGMGLTDNTYTNVATTNGDGTG